MSSPRRVSDRRRAGISSVHAKRATVGRPGVEVAPPLLREGQSRCPVCRNGVRVTSRGYLRAHRDMFGHDCHNRAIGGAA